jgi:sialate O-acetylesterase
VQFKNVETGLYVVGDSINGLEIAGEDKVFHPATSQVTAQGQLLVSSEKVSNPIAVRYGFTDWVEGNLFNTFGFPVSSFRTDDWDQ